MIYSLNRDKERVRLMNLLKQKEFWLFSHLCCKVRSLTNVENSFQKLFSDIKLYTLRIVLAQTLSTISTIMPSNLQELICIVSIVIIPIL